ncbi:MAG: hypothetical protein ACK56I_23050, partial [bacterium]
GEVGEAQGEVHVAAAGVGRDHHAVHPVAEAEPHERHRVRPVRRLAAPELGPGVREVEAHQAEPVRGEERAGHAEALGPLVGACPPGRAGVEGQVDLDAPQRAQQPLDGRLRREVAEAGNHELVVLHGRLRNRDQLPRLLVEDLALIGRAPHRDQRLL